jgi:hypothetical protein
MTALEKFKKALDMDMMKHMDCYSIAINCLLVSYGVRPAYYMDSTEYNLSELQEIFGNIKFIPHDFGGFMCIPDNLEYHLQPTNSKEFGIMLGYPYAGDIDYTGALTAKNVYGYDIIATHSGSTWTTQIWGNCVLNKDESKTQEIEIKYQKFFDENDMSDIKITGCYQRQYTYAEMVDFCINRQAYDDDNNAELIVAIEDNLYHLGYGAYKILRDKHSIDIFDIKYANVLLMCINEDKYNSDFCCLRTNGQASVCTILDFCSFEKCKQCAQNIKNSTKIDIIMKSLRLMDLLSCSEMTRENKYNLAIDTTAVYLKENQ